ncbi:glutamine amidotransferase class-I, partial [Ramicandelaber brevisporus]
RENNVPFLGICLGLQMATVEFARNVCGITNATSEEFVKDPAGVTYAVVHMPEISRDTMGANMRLGMRATLFEPDTESFKIRKLYGNAPIVHERHRHRYEVNPELVAQLEAAGMKYIGRDDKGQRMQVLELPAHKYFVATQYHPEYLSRPLHPSPPFLGLILAASGQLDDHLAGKPIGDHH